MEKYDVYHLPTGTSVKGLSKKEVEAFILERLCDYCRESLQKGFVECEADDGETYVFSIKYPSDTPCGAEYYINNAKKDLPEMVKKLVSRTS